MSGTANDAKVSREKRVEDFQPRSSVRRKRINLIFMIGCIVTAGCSILILAVLLTSIGMMGTGAIFNLGSESAEANPADETDATGDAESTASAEAEGPSDEGFVRTTFLTNIPDQDPKLAGIGPSVAGTIWVCGLCAFLTLPLGVATAIYLEEFQPRNRYLRWLHWTVQLNITNLAGVPSVVYGIIGLTAFVYTFGLFEVRQQALFEVGANYSDQFRTVYRDPSGRVYMVNVPVESSDADPTVPETGMLAFNPSGDQVELNVITLDDPRPTDEALQKRTVETTEKASRFSTNTWYHFRFPIGRGILAASLTLMLVILPVVIIASQEAIRAVPSSLREGALGLGCTPWQVVRNVTLPASIPGIMTGSILAMSRAIGEAAPILIIAGAAYVSFFPSSIVDDFSALPLQIYSWATRPQAPFHELAAGGIIVLLAILLTFNAIAVFIRQLTQRPLS